MNPHSPQNYKKAMDAAMKKAAKEGTLGVGFGGEPSRGQKWMKTRMSNLAKKTLFRNSSM